MEYTETVKSIIRFISACETLHDTATLKWLLDDAYNRWKHYSPQSEVEGLYSTTRSMIQSKEDTLVLKSSAWVQ